MSDLLAIVIYAGSVFIISTSLLILARVEAANRQNGPRSASFISAGASTTLMKKLSWVIGPGVHIFLPVGVGHYPLALAASGRLAPWERTIEKWARLGTRITIVISSPSEATLPYWQQLVDRLSPELVVCCLNRDLACSEDAMEIRTLDTFHPILAVKDGQPIAMWVENYHEADSLIAYNIEYYAREDIVGYQLARFERFYRVLQRLTDHEHLPPHLKLMSPLTRKQHPSGQIAA